MSGMVEDLAEIRLGIIHREAKPPVDRPLPNSFINSRSGRITNFLGGSASTALGVAEGVVAHQPIAGVFIMLGGLGLGLSVVGENK